MCQRGKVACVLTAVSYAAQALTTRTGCTRIPTNFTRFPVGSAKECDVLTVQDGNSAVPLSSGIARSGIGMSGSVEFLQGKRDFCLSRVGEIAKTKGELRGLKDLDDCIRTDLKGWNVADCSVKVWARRASLSRRRECSNHLSRPLTRNVSQRVTF